MAAREQDPFRMVVPPKLPLIRGQSLPDDLMKLRQIDWDSPRKASWWFNIGGCLDNAEDEVVKSEQLLRAEARQAGAFGVSAGQHPLLAQLVSQRLSDLEKQLQVARCAQLECPQMKCDIQCDSAFWTNKGEAFKASFRLDEADQRPQYICACRLQLNFYIHAFDKHFDYFGNDEAFMTMYNKRDVESGDLTTEQLRQALADVKAECNARAANFRNAAETYAHIEAFYEPLYADLRELNESFFTPRFIELFRKCRSVGAGPHEPHVLEDLGFEIVRPKGPLTTGTFIIPEMFTDDFLTRITEEFINFAGAGLKSTRPNSMNRNGGVLLEELGFQRFLDRLIFAYLNPVAKVLLAEEMGGGDLDSYKVFTVAYQAEGYDSFTPLDRTRRTTIDPKKGRDSRLSTHRDNSEITFNIHVAGNYTGGKLNLYGKSLENIADPKAKHVLERSGAESRGITAVHGGSEFHEAEGVETGWRLNLVIWARCSAVRNKRCPMCEKAPKVVEIPGVFGGEGFTAPPCERTTDKRLIEVLKGQD